MKGRGTYLLIFFASIALLAILIIQVNWMVQMAHIKEELFNEKANMVLSRTTEALKSNVQACRNIEESMNMDTSSAVISNLGNNEVRTIDSLFNHYMQFYNFHVDYAFEVTKPRAFTTDYGSGFASHSYNRDLNLQSGVGEVQLKLLLPGKKKFILAEMGPLFITSVLLIVVVLTLFWRTVLSLIKEKQLAEHTTDFLNNMTHEFKTPLTNIALAGKMIQKESPEADEKISHYSGIILEENEKLIFQVDQVLSMTALERGEIQLRKTTINIHELISNSIRMMSLQIDNREGKLSSDLRATKMMMEADKIHIIRALCNLIDNSIKYSFGPPDISIHSFNNEDSIVIEVSDHGIGIDKEYHKKIFEKYFRVPTGDVHDVKGFGIGLAYVKKIAELHNGTLSMHSEPGMGTKFILLLPNE